MKIFGLTSASKENCASYFAKLMTKKTSTSTLTETNGKLVYNVPKTKIKNIVKTAIIKNKYLPMAIQEFMSKIKR